MKKAIIYGFLASVFFAATPLLNRNINLSGGSVLWSTSLRYLFMLPMLYVIVKARKKGTKPVYQSMKRNPFGWLIWSTVGFGIFYLTISYATNYAQAWLVSGVWQLTIIAGPLMTPLWGKKIPIKALGFSSIIILGVILLEVGNLGQAPVNDTLLAILFVLISAFAYPLGNRKMMDVCRPEGLDTPQRVYGMTLASMPFLVCISVGGFIQAGLPTVTQLEQSFLVAIFSGIFATLLFFSATNMVKDNPQKLAIIEATQSGEVIATLIGSIFILNDHLPTLVGFIGLGVIILGMVLMSLFGPREEIEVIKEGQSPEA